MLLPVGMNAEHVLASTHAPIRVLANHIGLQTKVGHIQINQPCVM